MVCKPLHNEYTTADLPIPIGIGNTRVSFADLDNDGIINTNTEILQTQSYYPFGLEMSGLNSLQVGVENLYQFQGQELQVETGWSSFKWRNADPTIGRFFNVDPLADDPEQVDKSPFAFTWNNPIKLVDPDGAAPEIANCCGAEYRFRQQMKAKGGIQKEAEEYADKMHGNVGKQILRYLTPVEDIYGAITGKDFDGNDYNRVEASAWGLSSFIPLAKVGKLGKLGKVVVRNGEEVLEISDDASKAFKEAAQGRKHSKTLELALDRTIDQNKKSIRSFEKRISLHKDYIKNPKTKFKNWDDFSEARKQRELNHWQTEIKGFQEQIDITTDVINRY